MSSSSSNLSFRSQPMSRATSADNSSNATMRDGASIPVVAPKVVRVLPRSEKAPKLFSLLGKSRTPFMLATPDSPSLRAGIRESLSDRDEAAITSLSSQLQQSMLSQPSLESMNDIKNLLPPTFRARMFDILLELHNAAKKLAGVQEAILRLRNQKASGQFPPAIAARVKPPTLQFTNSYLSSQGEAEQKILSDLAVKQAKDMLDAFIAAKQREEAVLRNEVLASKSYEVTLAKAIEIDFEAAVELHGFTPEDQEMSEEPTPEFIRPMAFKTAPDFLKVERNTAKAWGSLLAIRAIELARIQSSRKDYLSEKKKALKDATSVRIAQETPKTEQERVNVLVKEALAAQKKGSSSKKGKGKPKKPRHQRSAGKKPEGIRTPNKSSESSSTKKAHKRKASRNVEKLGNKKQK